MLFTIPRAFARPTVLMTVLALSLVVGSPATQAKPPVRPGNVNGLAATVSKPAAAYSVSSSWTASANTTSYRVRLTNAAGTVLDSDTVIAPAWQASTTAAAGTRITVTVVPYNNSRRGPGSSKSTTLPDLTAPTGSYAVSESALVGTITEIALADDVTPASGITRTVTWGDASASESWTTGTTLNHTYAAQGRYLPTVALTDGAANTVTLDLPAIVINDTTAPTGSYSTAQATGWAAYTKVRLTQNGLSDDFSPAAFISRSVDWGDGVVEAWAEGVMLRHVYTVAGRFTPKVTVVDESDNSALLAAGPVSIAKDVRAPVVRLTLPVAKRYFVSSWRVLKGTAVDAGVGVRKVSVKAVQKRGKIFYAYRPAFKKWIKAGSTRQLAFAKAGAIKVVPNANGVWRANLANLKLGTLSYRVVGVDRVKNQSKTFLHSQWINRF